MSELIDIRDENGAHPVLVMCPECGQPGFLDAWPWIVSTRDERATKLLLSGDLFKYQCPVCEKTTTIVYDCMYHDVEHRCLALFSTGKYPEEQCCESLDKFADRAQWGSGSQTPAYQRRLVFAPHEFCEKARIWEQGYDDRVIELMKVALKRGMLREGIIGAQDTMIYERTLDDGGISFIVFGEIPGDVVGVPRGYEFLEKHLQTSAIPMQGEYRFDSTWADRFLP